ncbi:protein of unknown function [Acidithiobacillus ferrivorans]|uniref:Uncharacterized protein n=1 Tax=Acidithiobacillus ferrivorans TaxID=160808 RepID=A0A060UPL9_9PROT|nr:hypothetical protein [Acidithiobacillus ferrivorans]CDQ10542.1 hypothetical protein AFERRI_400323 [Acidithiobacillus ferrivorans]SMH64572.1 protein of unknown function [Acidithiobacillus ferrivorans]
MSVPAKSVAENTVIMEGSVLSEEEGLQPKAPFSMDLQDEQVPEPEYNAEADMVDDDEQTESDRRRRKMRIRRRVLVAQTRIQVQVRRRHKGREE